MRHLLTSLGLLALLGCGDAGGVLDPSQVAGTYTLKSIEGQPLPYSFPQSPTTVVIGDVITVTTRDAWTETGSYTTTLNGETTTLPLNDGGLVVRSETGGISFIRHDGDVAYTGRFLGMSLDLDRGGGGSFVSGGSDWLFTR